jgi:hypothetical protein
MTISEPALAQTASSADGELVLGEALRTGVPVAAFLGQLIGWSDTGGDPVLRLALKKASKQGDDWKSLLSGEPLPQGFYEWLGERFLNRAPSRELLSIGDAVFSAVYTSSIDPGLANLFATEGRQPEAVLIGDPPPPILRSRRRVPVYYLFGRAGAGIADFTPPSTNQSLSQRRLRHASAMLKTLNETATALGLIVIDGYEPAHDWLRGEDLLAVLGGAPVGGVLWCGKESIFSADDAETYRSLIDQGVIVRDERPLARLLVNLRARGEDWRERWDEPGIISFSDGKQLITTARLRLATQATAAIVDDGWLGFLPPLSKETEQSAFLAFHAVPAGPLGLIEGLRRDFAIVRDFESKLLERVNRAIAQHHLERGALVLHGQSGTGKTIALGRLALRIRENRSAAVLFAYNRLPQASDVADFLAEVDRVGAVTVLIADATSSYHRYDDLLQAFRSRGHRVVVVGSSYRLDQPPSFVRGRVLEAPAVLSALEADALIKLSQRVHPDNRLRPTAMAAQPYALARFFWELPSSRMHLSEGLGKETRTAEVTLRTRGTTKRAVQSVGDLGLALIRAGYAPPTVPLIAQTDTEEPGIGGAAGRVIDYVMAASRVYKWVPINLVLRAILSEGLAGTTTNSIELVRELFEGQDIFRWRFADEEGEELLVGARLQIEAELVCNRRLGGASGEASRLFELIRCAVRAGAEDNEETKFLTELVYALGPDGPFGERYSDSYAAIARTLTELRRRHGVLNARLMLQEATLRRHHVRTHSLDPEHKATLLDEARSAVDEALQALDRSDSRRLYASRRTRDNLWVERAATYSFLATDSARRGANNREIWSSYRAAREAVRIATGRVDTHFALDIGLWLPADVLRDAKNLAPNEKLELEADIRSTLDVIDPEYLDADSLERFQRQRFRVGEVLSDSALTEEAFAALAAIGSTAGYYLRARALASTRPEMGENATPEAQGAAKNAIRYLWSVYDHISADVRCLNLLLSCEWAVTTGRWLFRGQRQPLPVQTQDRLKIRRILLDLLSSAPNEVPARYRYLDAVLQWLTGDEVGARESFRTLGAETEYIERGRVIARHTITDQSGQPVLFDGVVERRIGGSRWSIFVEKLSRRVDLVENEREKLNLAVGRTLRGIAISFNYLGPIADLHPSRARNS